MVDIARVNLYGQTIGTFRWDHNRDIALFEYTDKFIGSGLEPSPILMPVAPGRVYAFPGIGRETFKGLPGLLADSLPDSYGRALFDRWLALTGRTSENAIETLCFLGKRCMGALEFEPAIFLTHRKSESRLIRSFRSPPKLWPKKAISVQILMATGKPQ